VVRAIASPQSPQSSTPSDPKHDALSRALRAVAKCMDLDDKAVPAAAVAAAMSDADIDRAFDWMRQLTDVESAVRPDGIVGWTDLRAALTRTRTRTATATAKSPSSKGDALLRGAQAMDAAATHDMAITILTLTASFMRTDVAVAMRRLLQGPLESQSLSLSQSQEDRRLEELIGRARILVLDGTSPASEDVRAAALALSTACVEAGVALSDMATQWASPPPSPSAKPHKYDADALATRLSVLAGMGALRRLMAAVGLTDADAVEKGASTPLRSTVQAVAGALIGKWASRLSFMRDDKTDEEVGHLQVLREEEKLRRMGIVQRLDDEGREMLKDLRRVRPGPVDWAAVERDFVSPDAPAGVPEGAVAVVDAPPPQGRNKAVVEDAIDAYWA
jgi:lysozyme family protein